VLAPESGAGEPTGPEGGADRSQRPSWADLSSIRIPYALAIAVAASVLAFAWILYGDRKLDFYFDEWAWVDRSSHWTLRDYFLPHNEHWSTVPMLVYKLLFEIQGAHSYLPFLGAMALAHVVAGFLLFLIVRGRAGDALALAATAIFLFIGTGAEDLYWAFQLGFDASVMFGLLALYLMHPREAGRVRQLAGFAAMLLALASSGIGLFYCAAVGVDMALDRERRRRLWTVAVSAVVYVTWYEMFGKAGVRAAGDRPLSLSTIEGLVQYVPSGIGAVVAGVFGAPSGYSQLMLPLVLVAVALMWYRERRVDSLVLGVVAGLVFQFTLTGLARAQYGTLQADSSRYIGAAAPLVLIVLADAARRLPSSRVTVAVLAAVSLVALFGNVTALHDAQTARNAEAAFQKDELETLWLFRDAPDLKGSAVVDTNNMPTLTADDYISSRRNLGSPLPGVSLSQLSRLRNAPVNQVMRNVMPLVTRTLPRRAPASARTCTSVGLSGGTVNLQADGGSTFYVTASSIDSVAIEYWYQGPSAGYTPQAVTVAPGTTLAVTLPQTGMDVTWHVSIANSAPAEVCR
jgi:hypothetical protein